MMQMMKCNDDGNDNEGEGTNQSPSFFGEGEEKRTIKLYKKKGRLKQVSGSMEIK